MEQRMRVGFLAMFAVTGLTFLGLVARLVFLGTASVDRVAAANGLEVEIFHQYPPLMEVEAPAQPRQVRVPALVGRTFAQAGEALVGTGLVIEGLGDVTGRVVRQAPAAGRTAPAGSAVRVWLEP